MNEMTLVPCEQFSEAYAAGYPMTKRFLLSRGAPADTAEEVAQAAWAKGWECRYQLQQPKMLGVWINSIAKNMLLNLVRTERRFDDLDESVKYEVPPSTSIDAKAVLNHCAPRDAHILSDYYLEGYTTDEIAEKVGLCPATVRVRLLRLRRMLRARFADALKNAEPIRSAA